jgi:WD40 repeat protein
VADGSKLLVQTCFLSK